MKIQKIFISYLTIGAVVMSLLLGASAVQAQNLAEVILDPGSTAKRATGITNLTVEGNVYNVTFTSYITALEVYGEVEGIFVFPSTVGSAQNVVNAVNYALNGEGGVLFVGSEGGTNDEFAEAFNVGFRYQHVSVGDLDGCNVQTGFTEDGTGSWIGIDEPDVLSWYADERTYIELTPVSGCTPITECLTWFECGVTNDGCGGTIECGTCPEAECGTTVSCVNNICESCTPAIECTAGFNCGTEDNGCGGTIDCGTCTAECGTTASCVDNICTSQTNDLDEIIDAYCEEVAQISADASEDLGTAYSSYEECFSQYADCLLSSAYNMFECITAYLECFANGNQGVNDVCLDAKETFVDATTRAYEEAAAQGFEDEFTQFLYSPEGAECLSEAILVYETCDTDI